MRRQRRAIATSTSSCGPTNSCLWRRDVKQLIGVGATAPPTARQGERLTALRDRRQRTRALHVLHLGHKGLHKPPNLFRTAPVRQVHERHQSQQPLIVHPRTAVKVRPSARICQCIRRLPRATRKRGITIPRLPKCNRRPLAVTIAIACGRPPRVHGCSRSGQLTGMLDNAETQTPDAGNQPQKTVFSYDRAKGSLPLCQHYDRAKGSLPLYNDTRQPHNTMTHVGDASK